MSHVVQLPTYAVYSGALREAFSVWRAERHYSSLFLLTDTNTAQACRPAFLAQTGLPEGLPGYSIAAGEAHKTLATCEQVWQAMFAAGLDRQALVINLGGGVVGDLGGFCAATYKRGVDFVQAPTTLLAMTDAAIGGKTGIDFQGLKNAVGAFRDPAAVFVDPAFLRTLPERELRSGLAEVIKHALIGAPDLAETLRTMSNLAVADWANMLPASIAVKVAIVTDDPLEKGRRALLNFGHTVGHALESWALQTDAPLTHGEAVAAGMICESWLAWGDNGRTANIARLIGRFFPLQPIPEVAFPQLWTLMQQDKKNASGTVRMAVPEAENPGAIHWLAPTREAVEASLRFYNSAK